MTENTPQQALNIRKGIPIPPKGRRARHLPKLPFDALDVGDSFIVEDGDAGSIRVQAVDAARSTGRHFTTRSLGKGAVGVWRIA